MNVTLIMVITIIIISNTSCSFEQIHVFFQWNVPPGGALCRSSISVVKAGFE